MFLSHLNEKLATLSQLECDLVISCFAPLVYDALHATHWVNKWHPSHQCDMLRHLLASQKNTTD